MPKRDGGSFASEGRWFSNDRPGVRVNGSLDNGLTNSRDVGRSSDSGVHSWTEQWVNMSDNSMDGSYDDTKDLRRNISDEMSRLMFGAPPNTEDEGDSDYPGTDGSLTEMLDGCPSEATVGSRQGYDM